MNILVFGASGQIGQHLLREGNRRGHRTTGTYCSYAVSSLRLVDLSRPGSAIEAARQLKPDWIFSTAAWAHVDGCEQDPDAAMRLNVGPTQEAAKAAAAVGARFCYFSSDYVYDGTATLNTEETRPAPLNAYGRAKLEAERIAIDLVPEALIVRTAVVYGPERRGKNTLYQLVRASLEGTPFRAAHDQLCSPTYSPNLAAACIELAEQGASGVLHVAGTEVMSRYEFALMACDILQLDESVLEPVATAELGGMAPRPLLNGLDVSKASAFLRQPLFSCGEGLGDFFKQAPVAALRERLPV